MDGHTKNEIPSSEKLEFIKLVEQSYIPATRTIDQLGITPRTFYHYYERYPNGGQEAMTDKPSAPRRV